MGADSPKQFRLLSGVPVIVFTLRRLAQCPAIDEFLIATRGDDIESLGARLAEEQFDRPVRVVRGGDTRQESVRNALAEVPTNTDLVLVHDAVRPLVTREQAERVISEAEVRGAVILGIPAMDTVKEVKRASLPGDVALITATIRRERVVLAQTPQAFHASLSRAAFAVACDSKRLSEVRVCLNKDFSFRDCAEVTRRTCRRDQIAMPAVRGG